MNDHQKTAWKPKGVLWIQGKGFLGIFHVNLNLAYKRPKKIIIKNAHIYRGGLNKRKIMKSAQATQN